MVVAADLLGLRVVEDPTAKIKQDLAALRGVREPYFLTGIDFDRILRWKLRSQYSRQLALRAGNTPAVIEVVTRAALNIEHEDPQYEMELRVGLLCTLRGVGVPVASAVLALTCPQEYGIIDFRGWRQLFGEGKTLFSIADYWQYLTAIRTLARELGWPAQEVDLALWTRDFGPGGPPPV